MEDQQEEVLETTWGDLIVALTEGADRLARDRRQAHIFVAYILFNVLSRSAPISQTWQ
jgi:hypothetical protein